MDNTALSLDELGARDLSIAERLAAIENTHDVKFEFNHDSNSIEAEGFEENVNAALVEMQPREAFVEAIKVRQAPPRRKRVKVRLAASVPCLAVQRQNYVRWFRSKSQLYWRTDEELDRMFALCEEGDECLFDFAYSFTVRKPNGLLVAVNKQGKFEEVSPYSPHRASPVGEQ